MVSIVDMLKRSEKFSLAFDRSMPIRFQQQFWQLIAFLDKHDITWFNDEPASDHAMCQQLLGQVWRQDCQDVVLMNLVLSLKMFTDSVGIVYLT